MRFLFFVAALLVTALECEGAALLRFINTVPTRESQVPVKTFDADTDRVLVPEWRQDRVGIQYIANSPGNTQAATYLWTELMSPGLGTDVANFEGNAANTPFAWTHAMPALRQYHTRSATAPVLGFDRISSTGDSETDYEQTTFKADGVCGYMSFAPGTYRLQAYVVLGATTASNVAPYTNAVRSIAASNSLFTFEDNRVYTLVAIGDGQYAATPTPLVGNTISLRLFEESTASTTFGKAAVRWFHAATPHSTATISVYNGEASTSAAIATNIAFGALSSYVDVAPGSARVFPISSSASASAIAPSTATKFEVTHDVRAGMRATIICAVNNIVDGNLFCRMIPSRVVAYVRLVNDLAGTTSLTQGAVGSVPLNRVNLTLWASQEIPRPEQVVELSQTGGVRSFTNTPANVRGLYKVVSSVSAGTVSGYGEVFVPILIMDFAVRYTMARDIVADLGAPSGAIANTNQIKPAAAAAGLGWFLGAPTVKRVNFIVKTDSGSTLSGMTAAVDNVVRRVYTTTTVTDLVGWVDNSLTIDKIIEPGQYQSIIITPILGTNGRAATVGQVTTEVRFYWRLDRTIAQVSSGVGSGKGTVAFVPFAEQAWNGGTGTLFLRSKVNGVSQSVAGMAVDTASKIATSAGAAAGSNEEETNTAASFIVNAGAYSVDFTTTAAVTCINHVPGVTDVTLADGDITDVYVLNQYGCIVNNADTSRLSVVVAKSKLATQTGHAAGTLLAPGATSSTQSPTFFFAGATSFTFSSTALISLVILAVAALV